MDPIFIGKAKISSQGQITVPREARSNLKIEPNSEIYAYLLDDSIVFVKDLMNQKDLLEHIKESTEK